ncbi:hypothetical protein SPH9361_04642 [Sphingobium sp. CECT 9361]|nr:hypothetical protein SPH9361_04642 [Sphingobium sp. CECT 9361]
MSLTNPARPLEDDHLHRRVTPDRNDHTDGVGRADDWRWFTAYAEQVLAPTLRPGDVVILGNLPAHKSIAAREAVEATGARMLFLPPYSPDFNPIQHAFSKLKAILRKAAARTVPDLWDVIRYALLRFTPDECANYFTATGYEPE